MMKMEKTIQQRKDEIINFFSEAFCTDGESRILSHEEKIELLKDSNIDVIELNDSERGKFWLGVITKKE